MALLTYGGCSGELSYCYNCCIICIRLKGEKGYQCYDVILLLLQESGGLVALRRIECGIFLAGRYNSTIYMQVFWWWRIPWVEFERAELFFRYMVTDVCVSPGNRRLTCKITPQQRKYTIPFAAHLDLTALPLGLLAPHAYNLYPTMHHTVAASL